MFGIAQFQKRTSGPFRERTKSLKSKVKMKAGGGIARVAKHRSAKPGESAGDQGTERKAVDMKNALENSTRNALPQTAVETPRAGAQELFEVEEWEGLLNSFEDGPSESPAAATNDGEIALGSDELWERLSSTRWLRERAESIDRSSTLAQRPMD